MRGVPELNRSSFDYYERALTELGYDACNPWLEDDVPDDFDYDMFELYTAMRRDFEMISMCDTVFLMPEWASSKGANVERALGLYLGLNVIDYLGTVHTHEVHVPAPRKRRMGEPVGVIPLSPFAVRQLDSLRCEVQ